MVNLYFILHKRFFKFVSLTYKLSKVIYLLMRTVQTTAVIEQGEHISKYFHITYIKSQ